MRSALLLLLITAAAVGAPTGAQLAHALDNAGLDPGACYRVLDLNLTRADIRVYLTSGYIAFAKPVNGQRTGAVFVTDVEGGDAEVIIMPPLRSERQSLAHFTQSPNLDEHFRSAIMIFTDGTAAELERTIAENPVNKRVPDTGGKLAATWDPAVRNLSASFETRLIGDLLSGNPRSGFFYMGVSGRALGNFDVIYDPTTVDQITAGQLNERTGRSYFDVWTSFAAATGRKGAPRPVSPSLDEVNIDAKLEPPDLRMTAVTTGSLSIHEPTGRALQFSISRQMRVTGAKIDGQTAEVFQHESLRSNLIRSPDEEQFLIITAEPLSPGEPHRFEIHHEGSVIASAGNRVFFVTSRGNWYPRIGFDFARYQLTFRYPKDFTLVATGEMKEDRTDGEWRITQYQPSAPIRFAGFNLGDYISESVKLPPWRINVFANRRLEGALQPKPTLEVQSRRRGNPQPPASAALLDLPTPDPAARLKTLAHDVRGVFEFLEGKFGPPPIRDLAISPIPGTFGQGFPGLVYLSTLAYLPPEQRPIGTRDTYVQTFYSELLMAHEVAHQWWGNLVTPAGYGDIWLSEALANYSALLYLEKMKGPKALDAVLNEYRNHLVHKTETGLPIDSAGPIVWGYRLQNSQVPDAWRIITYEKGSWIIHMLRRQLGDERFGAMLRDLCARYRLQPLSTQQFQEEARRYVPSGSPDPKLDAFFDTWVYGTGIPVVQVSWSQRAGRIAGSVSQTGVDQNFSAYVPIEIQSGASRTVRWVATSSEPASFSLPSRGAARVALDGNDALIVTKTK